MTGLQPTCFGLVRHGTTLWNEKKMIQGQQDSPLSPAGQQEAARWGRKLVPYSWQRILCSDLGRAQETSELINQTLNLPIHRDERLREQNWGEWTGMTLAGIREQQLKQLEKQVRSGWLFKPTGGESREAVLKRSLAALENAHTSWPGEKILIVCHEGVIKCLLYHLAGRKFLPEEPPLIKPKQLHFLVRDDTALYLKEVNSILL